jgi:hypothetical protein
MAGMDVSFKAALTKTLVSTTILIRAEARLLFVPV